MTYLKILATICVILAIGNPCFSADQNISFTKDEFRKMNLNKNVLTMDRDSSIFLHSLAMLKSGNGHEVEEFMEYQLDEIVIAAWKFKEEMNKKQQDRIMNFLHSIKSYRKEHPRDPNRKIDPTVFSQYFAEFDETYAERADKILGSIN